MATTQASTSAALTELHTLTLDHILSDLELLPSDHAIFSHTSINVPNAEATATQTQPDLLSAFERGSSPMNTKDYVALSHQLLAKFKEAQRLNNEQVSAGEVGLVLPSERSLAAAATTSSSSSSSMSARNGRTGSREEKIHKTATRTDLLHGKVADLQTQVDAWDGALQRAVQLVEDPQAKSTYGEGAAKESRAQKDESRTTSDTAAAAAASTRTTTTARNQTRTPETSPAENTTTSFSPSEEGGRGGIVDTRKNDEDESELARDLTQSSDRQSASNPDVEETFQDDDPWNDLT